MQRFQALRWTFFLAGQLLLALGITLTIKGSMLGINPWDVLHVGLFMQLGLTIGTWSILTGLFIVVSTSIYLRRLPQIGTWINMVLIGSFIDLFNWILPDVHSLAGQTSVFLAGIAVQAVGLGMYVSPGIGAGPRDTLMLVLMEKTGWSVKTVRTVLEASVALAGWLIGGPVGIGTVIIVLFFGQLLQFTIPYFRGLLERQSGAREEATAG
ncbi:putative BCR, YitT family [Bhargavaea cecembensis DSE10]|uniref:Putative BCR, YitT family n=1 Tax=Bhargavaea cecembensis DSE10 TaxID=1235279 RepID=M7NKU7_9BACL|nr:membrane protein [Bhargavaea cecembensis]EMR07822.1 putative BCR, YitT family [Bhargavaea cecembensis DSE10]